MSNPLFARVLASAVRRADPTARRKPTEISVKFDATGESATVKLRCQMSRITVEELVLACESENGASISFSGHLGTGKVKTSVTMDGQNSAEHALALMELADLPGELELPQAIQERGQSLVPSANGAH